MNREYAARKIMEAGDWDACREQVEWLKENELTELDLDGQTWRQEVEDWCSEVLGLDLAEEFVYRLWQNAPECSIYIRIEDAAEDLKQFAQDGWKLPQGLTAERLFETWNQIADDSGYVLTNNGKTIDFEAAVNIMDDDLREVIHNDLAPCSNQEFYDEYCKRHLEKFDEEFEPDKEDGQW